MNSFAWVTLLAAVVAVAEVGLRLLALGVIPGNRKPSTGMAWLLLILVEPILGSMLFWCFGRISIGRTRHERQLRAKEVIASRTDASDSPDTILAPAYVVSAAHLSRTLGALPMLADNRADLISDYETSIAQMTEAVSRATDFVHVEFYITAWDEVTGPFFEALLAATRRGVRVRMLFDHLGSRGIPGFKAMLTQLDATAIEWRLMLPVSLLKGKWRRPDLRNHRKLVVVDGTVGFTGSQNLTEPGYNKPKNHELGRKWVELMVRLEGPIVPALNAVFASDWYVESGEVPDLARATRSAQVPAAPGGECGVGCQLVPSGPGYVAENNLRMFTTLIYGASRRISLTSPYFVPDESLLYAVTTAAQRGVEVELFVSEVSDQFMVGHAQASYYRALLEAGVRIYQYPAPLILHSKHFTIDDDVAVVGSSNMDMRSFALNYEISLMMVAGGVVARMREVEDAYRRISHLLTLEEWQGRPARTKYVDNVMRLTAALQ